MKRAQLILALILALTAVSVFAEQAQQAAPVNAADPAPVTQKELERQLQAKRFDFEERYKADEIQFDTQMRKARHDAQLEHDRALEASGKDKAARKALLETDREQAKVWRAKRAEFRAAQHAKRKDFEALMKAERVAFRKSRPVGHKRSRR